MLKLKKDSMRLGLTLAVLLPLLIFTVAFLIRFHEVGYLYALKSSAYQPIFPKMFSLCVYPNGLIFYIFIRTDYVNTMRGMLIGTVAMALIALLLYLAYS